MQRAKHDAKGETVSNIRRGLKWFVVAVTLTLIACGGDPGGASQKASDSAALEGDVYTLTVRIDGNGSGSVSGSYSYVQVDGSTAVVPFGPFGSCTFSNPCEVTGIPWNASVTVTGLAAADSNFTGFKKPYCSVYACDWSDPAFEPPTEYAWSGTDYTFTMGAQTTVYARFTLVPPTQYTLKVYVTGSTAQEVTATVNGTDTPFNQVPCPPSAPGSFVRLCTMQLTGGDVVTLTGYPNPNKVQFQKRYCDVYQAFCNAMMAANPDWYPRPTVVWVTAPYTFTMTEAKYVSARVLY